MQDIQVIPLKNLEDLKNLDIQLKHVYFDIQYERMMFVDLSTNKFYFTMLYDKDSDESIANIERKLKLFADVLTECTDVYCCDIKSSLSNYHKITGEMVFLKNVYDVRTVSQLTSDSILLKLLMSANSSTANIDTYIENQMSIMKASFKQHESKIHDILKECIVPYVLMENKGLRVKKESQEDENLRKFLISQSSSLKDNDDEFVLYPRFDMFGAITGRTSCNLHALPKNIRHHFIAREGKKIISLDYNAGEARILAELSQDKNLCSIFNDKVDLHTLNAALLFDKNKADITEEDRDEAKKIFFAAVNGATSAIDKKLITAIKCSYLDAFKYIEQLQEKTAKDGFIINPYGRKRIMNAEFEENDWSARVKASNNMIQSTLSDMKLDAISRIYHKFGNIILLEIHDSVILEVDADKAEQIKDDVVEIMRKPSIPWSIDMSVNYNVNGCIK